MNNWIAIIFTVGILASIFIDEESKENIGKKTLSLEPLLEDKHALFQHIKYKNGRDDRAYSYCETKDNIHDVINDNLNRRLIVVCKLESKSDFSHSRFFKYSALYNDGKVVFCGWRDFARSHNAYSKRWENKFSDSRSKENFKDWKSPGCNNFDIMEYSHGD